MNLIVRPDALDDSQWLNEFMETHWGGLPLVIRGKKYYPSTLDGLVAENEEGIAGFIFYEIKNQTCEIIVFDVFEKFKGGGTLLLKKLIDIAVAKHCQRLYVMTTNDNLDALRFYQRKGFKICDIHINSVEISRKIKPTIGLIGDYGIPVRDEIDLELIL